MLRVSNIALLLTKPDQVANAGRYWRENQNNLTSNLQLYQNQREKKNKEVKTSLLA